MTKHYYITTPIYYVNDKPHIGHAYTTLACDVIARFMRLDGYTVKFLTGTDEHGQKVEKAAIEAGKTPQDFVNEFSQNFRSLCERMNFSHDDFIRTTEERHFKSATAFWQRLAEHDAIYLGSYAGWYAIRDEAFYTESELVNGKAPTGAEVEWVEEPSYFFRLSKFQDKLLAFYEHNPHFIAPLSKRNEIINFVKGGLRDLSISRTSFKWGIPVPGDPRHVMYVWIEALCNYITALGFPDMDAPTFQDFWPAQLHMVGKDILRFHTVYWPAFLIAADIAPPKRVFAHGWWTKDGDKISKSLGNTMDPLELIDQYGLDQTRYFLLREVPFGGDGDFSKNAMVNRINSNLSNDLGNLVQRTASMVYKNCDGKIPLPHSLQESDLALIHAAEAILPSLRENMKEQALHKVLDTIWQVVGAANRYVDSEAPWVLLKTDMTRMETVLYTLMETIRHLGLYLQPFMPDSAAKILDLLGVDSEERTFGHRGKQYRLRGNTPIQEPTPIFPRYVED